MYNEIDISYVISTEASDHTEVLQTNL